MRQRTATAGVHRARRTAHAVADAESPLLDGSGGRLRFGSPAGTERVAAACCLLGALLACDDRTAGDRTGPVDPGGQGAALVVVKAVLPGDATSCGELSTPATSVAACPGDSLPVTGLRGPVDAMLGGDAVVSYGRRIAAGDTAAVWLLRREHAAALAYLTQLVNVSGSRPFPFGLPGLPIAVELDGPDTGVRDDVRAAVERTGAAVSAWTGRETFVFVPELAGPGLRIGRADVGAEGGRSTAESFTAGHKLVCRIEVDAGLPPGPALSARIAHELGHCLGLTRHDPLDTPGRLMHRLAPAESWGPDDGPSPFDGLVLALTARAAEDEIALAGFR
jgi:hypothetical protein